MKSKGVTSRNLTTWLLLYQNFVENSLCSSTSSRMGSFLQILLSTANSHWQYSEDICFIAWTVHLNFIAVIMSLLLNRFVRSFVLPSYLLSNLRNNNNKSLHCQIIVFATQFSYKNKNGPNYIHTFLVKLHRYFRYTTYTSSFIRICELAVRNFKGI